MAKSFISKLLRRPATQPQAEDTSSSAQPLGADERIYAIGDLHGCAHLLDAMWDLIRADLKQRPVGKAEIVYLGDYVDRGADSAGVIERLTSPPADLPSRIALMGNHERIFMDFLAGKEVGDALRDIGGFETLRSYGVEPTDFPGWNWIKAAHERMETRMPKQHRDFLNALALSYDRPPYFFCHAGVRPGVPVDKQDPKVLLWIRDSFLRSEEDFGRIVVHGHTPVAAPDVRHNRINVDTGAYKTGTLSCAVLDLESVRILQTDSALSVS